MEKGGQQVGKRLAHARAGFHDKVFATCQRACDRGGHGLLLRSPFEPADRGQTAILCKERLDLGGKAGAGGMVFVE